MADSPCKTCTRVKKPEYCVDKNCKDWNMWFVKLWNRLHCAYEPQLQQMEGTEDGNAT